jgi:predicted lipoprotein with Yx(FWY)xxD motif
MTRSCVYCGDPTDRLYSFDMDLLGVPACSDLCLHLWFDREQARWKRP